MWELFLVEITAGKVRRHVAKLCSVGEAPTCGEASAHKSAGLMFQMAYLHGGTESTNCRERPGEVSGRELQGTLPAPQVGIHRGQAQEGTGREQQGSVKCTLFSWQKTTSTGTQAVNELC